MFVTQNGSLNLVARNLTQKNKVLIFYEKPSFDFQNIPLVELSLF
jgi:hypothetical protein